MKSIYRKSAIKRIVFFRFDRMGDLIVSTPALRALRKSFPESEITAVLSITNAKVIRDSDLVDHVIIYDNNKLDVLRKLRKLKPQVSVVLSPKSFAYIAGLLMGASIRVGLVMTQWPLKKFIYNKLLTRSFIYSRRNYVSSKVLHHADIMFNVVKLLGVKKGTVSYEVAFNEKPYHLLKKILGHEKVLGIHLDDRWFNEGWSASTFQRLVAHIKSVWSGRIVIAHTIRNNIGVTLINENNLDQLSQLDVVYLDNPSFDYWQALIKVSDIWLTTDGGSIHVASSVGTPVVTMIEKNDYFERSHEWHPRGVPYRLVCRDNDADKTSKKIIEAVASLAVDRIAV